MSSECNTPNIIMHYFHIVLKAIFGAYPEMISKVFADLEPGSTAGNIAVEVGKWDFKDPLIYSFISNANGVGKTHLAICLLKKYIFDTITSKVEQFTEKHGEFDHDKFEGVVMPKVYFLREVEFYNELIEGLNQKQTEKEVMQRYLNCDFLVYDDLFAYRDSDIIRRAIYYILDERIAWKGKPLVITSNYNAGQIKAIDSRIISRMSAGRIFEIENSKNYRVKKL